MPFNEENQQFLRFAGFQYSGKINLRFGKINYIFNIHANINGTTMVASDSTINLGV
jgi:hypothetical protein